MKKLMLLGCALLVIVLSVVAATTIKADVGNNPRQLVVDAKWVSGGPPSENLPTGGRSWMLFELYPEGQVVPGDEIGEKFIDFIALPPTGSASFNEELYVIEGKGVIYGFWYHVGEIGEGEAAGIIIGGTGAFHGASGEYSITPTETDRVHRVTFNFDDARNTHP